jgi:uncharacterized caspase-like protein
MSNYALIIGINDYTAPAKKGLPTLKGAVKDATAVRDWLVNNNKVPAANCRLITSTSNPLNPIKNDIDTAIVEILDKVVDENGKDADRLYFYFAGHGFGVDRDAENNALCMANWSFSLSDAATLSSSDYKRKFLREGFFKEIIIWMDCCRNTRVNLVPGANGGLYPDQGPNMNPKWFVAYASQFQNQAFEAETDGEEPRGVFTTVLLNGLNGAAVQNGEPINADDLRDYLFRNLPVVAKAKGLTQRPDVNHNSFTDDPIIF